MQRATAAVFAAGLLACTACSAGATTAGQSSAPPAAGATPTPDAITVTGAVVVAPVTAGDPADVLFTVVNGTGVPDEITAVSSPVGSQVQLDNTLGANPTDPIEIAAHAATQLTPFGPDVWVFDPALLHVGATVPVTVHFQHAAPVTVNAVVRSPAQTAQTSNPASAGD